MYHLSILIFNTNINYLTTSQQAQLVIAFVSSRKFTILLMAHKFTILLMVHVVSKPVNCQFSNV